MRYGTGRPGSNTAADRQRRRKERIARHKGKNGSNPLKSGFNPNDVKIKKQTKNRGI